MFNSRTITTHILRGAIGFGALILALVYAPQLGWWSLLLFGIALFSFRGCPLCWTVGLIETVLYRRRSASCPDGSCANRTKPELRTNAE